MKARATMKLLKNNYSTVSSYLLCIIISILFLVKGESLLSHSFSKLNIPYEKYFVVVPKYQKL